MIFWIIIETSRIYGADNGWRESQLETLPQERKD